MSFLHQIQSFSFNLQISTIYILELDTFTFSSSCSPHPLWYSLWMQLSSSSSLRLVLLLSILYFLDLMIVYSHCSAIFSMLLLTAVVDLLFKVLHLQQLAGKPPIEKPVRSLNCVQSHPRKMGCYTQYTVLDFLHCRYILQTPNLWACLLFYGKEEPSVKPLVRKFNVNSHEQRKYIKFRGSFDW